MKSSKTVACQPELFKCIKEKVSFTTVPCKLVACVLYQAVPCILNCTYYYYATIKSSVLCTTELSQTELCQTIPCKTAKSKTVKM